MKTETMLNNLNAMQSMYEQQLESIKKAKSELILSEKKVSKYSENAAKVVAKRLKQIK